MSLFKEILKKINSPVVDVPRTTPKFNGEQPFPVINPPDETLPPMPTVQGVEALSPQPLAELPSLGTPTLTPDPMNDGRAMMRDELPPLNTPNPFAGTQIHAPVVGASQPLTHDLPPLNRIPIVDAPTAAPTAPLTTGEKFQQAANNAQSTLPNDLPPLGTQSEISAIQGKNYSKAHYDNNGNYIAAGKDRDKKWSLGDKIGSALLGGLQGLATGGIGGAIAGGVTAGTDRNFMEKGQDRKELSKLYPRLEAEREAQKFNLETQKQGLANQKTLGEIGQQDIDAINSRVKPLLEVFQSDKKIDEKEAATLSKMTGLPYSPTQWQSYIDKEINGKTFTRSEYDPRYAENKTVPIDPTEVPRNIKIGDGNPFPLTPKQAAPIMAATEQGNANRQQSATQFTEGQKRLSEQFSQNQALEIQKYNFDEYGKYQGSIAAFQKDKMNAQRAIAENKPLVDTFTAQLTQDEAALNAMSADEQQVFGDKLRASITNARAKIAEAQGKVDGANYFVSNAAAPSAPNQISAPKNSSGKLVGRSKVAEYAKQKGISFKEAKKHAEGDGYTVK